MNCSSTFTNSCIKVPIDPKSKMPKTAYERMSKIKPERYSIDSLTTCSGSTADVHADNVKDFYRSIPDYNEINHLSSSEFYSTLQTLREKKKSVLGFTAEESLSYSNKKNFDYEDDNISIKKQNGVTVDNTNNILKAKSFAKKSKVNRSQRDRSFQYPKEPMVTSFTNSRPEENCCKTNPAIQSAVNVKRMKVKVGSKRNHSACSISWRDDKLEDDKNEVDKKFEKFFQVKPLDPLDSTEFRTQSMPSSPLRTKSVRACSGKNKNITIPNPFKMSERDTENRMKKELQALQKSFSDDMLNQKRDRKQFHARPVPIESRIPLYDKILEDQAMRRAITKINSEAELRAQMKPFSFTQREENGTSGVCERVAKALPKPKKNKHFRARPVPKNLFSNYFYEKVKQDDFFRSMNRRIRSEELLRNANYPGNMAARDRSHLSTPAAHSDLPTDPSPAALSTSSSDRFRCSSPTKRCKQPKDDFVTTSPQPFRFRTASRANQKMRDIAQKVYQSCKSSVEISDVVDKSHAYSALELKSAAVGRSNLAALLRAESVRRRFEMEAERSLAEQRRRIEIRQRDRQLRSKPAWHLVKNNHNEDIAMRLQTRRDEERMRREEFLHEMELMYGRVQQQPLLFERYYAPRLHSPSGSIQLSPRKYSKKRSCRKNKRYQTTESSGDYCGESKNKDINKELFDSSAEIIDSVERICL